MGTTLVDQRHAPASFQEAGAAWQNLGGTFEVLSGALTVQLSDLATAGTYLIADAIRIERIGDSPAGAHVQVIDGTSSVAEGGSVNIGRTDPGTPLLHTFTVSNASTATSDLTLGNIGLAPGFALVTGFGQTVLAPGQSTTFTVEFTSSTLGYYSGSITIATSDLAHPQFSFAVTATVSVVTYQDDSGQGFTATAGWLNYIGAGWQGEMDYIPAGNGSEVATWTFSGLPAGTYVVSVTWEQAANRSPNAAYTVLDGSTALGTTLVNQQNPPASFQDSGASWQTLSGTYGIQSGVLRVQLSDLAAAGTYLIADAVRIERIA
jgi:hypothetical protein